MPNLFVNIDMILSNGFVSVDSVPLILPFYFLFLFVCFIHWSNCQQLSLPYDNFFIWIHRINYIMLTFSPDLEKTRQVKNTWTQKFQMKDRETFTTQEIWRINHREYFHQLFTQISPDTNLKASKVKLEKKKRKYRSTKAIKFKEMEMETLLPAWVPVEIH